MATDEEPPWDPEALHAQLCKDFDSLELLMTELEQKSRRRCERNHAKITRLNRRRTQEESKHRKKERSRWSRLRRRSHEDEERLVQYKAERAIISAVRKRVASPKAFAVALDEACRYATVPLRACEVEPHRRGLERRFWIYQAWLPAKLRRKPTVVGVNPVMRRGFLGLRAQVVQRSGKPVLDASDQAANGADADFKVCVVDGSPPEEPEFQARAQRQAERARRRAERARNQAEKEKQESQRAEESTEFAPHGATPKNAGGKKVTAGEPKDDLWVKRHCQEIHTRAAQAIADRVREEAERLRPNDYDLARTHALIALDAKMKGARSHRDLRLAYSGVRPEPLGQELARNKRLYTAVWRTVCQELVAEYRARRHKSEADRKT